MTSTSLQEHLDNHVRKNTTVDDGVNALVDHIESRVKEALTGLTLSQEMQSRLDAVFDDVQSNKAKVAMALMTGTAHEPPKWTPPAEPNRSAVKK
jgi:hypothetical protein